MDLNGVYNTTGKRANKRTDNSIFAHSHIHKFNVSQ